MYAEDITGLTHRAQHGFGQSIRVGDRHSHEVDQDEEQRRAQAQPLHRHCLSAEGQPQRHAAEGGCLPVASAAQFRSRLFCLDLASFTSEHNRHRPCKQTGVIRLHLIHAATHGRRQPLALVRHLHLPAHR